MTVLLGRAAAVAFVVSQILNKTAFTLFRAARATGAKYRSAWSLSVSKLTRAATASAPSAVAGATPSRAISAAASRTASCMRLRRCSPKVAPRATVTRRARSSAASRCP